MRVIERAMQVMRKEENVVYIEDPCIIIADIHG
jgi:hypothetical protein